MKEIAKLGVILFIIAGISAAILGFINEKTYPVVQAQIEEANNLARNEVLPDAKEFLKSDVKIDSPLVKEVYEGKNGDELVGYTIKTAPKGYGGEVEVMVGITVDGVINGVAIGNHTETPGLGSKATDIAFKGQYAGKKVDNPVEVIKNGSPSDSQIVAIAGATITSQAVTSGVNEALKIYNDVLSN